MPSRPPPAKPYLEELYDEIPPGYYDAVYRRGRGAQWYWHEQRFRTVERLLPKPCGRLLDLGCGPGSFLGNLRVPVESGLGIDLAAAQIDYARRAYARPNLDFRHADVRALPLEETFDAIVSIEVIEHLPPEQTQPFLRTILERLEPGGTAVLTTPNYRSLWRLIEPVLSTIGPVDYRPQHINRFNARRLRDEVAAAGFTAVQVETFFVLSPFLAGVSRRLADRLLRIERDWLPSWGAELAVRAERPSALAAGTGLAGSRTRRAAPPSREAHAQ